MLLIALLLGSRYSKCQPKRYTLAELWPFCLGKLVPLGPSNRASLLKTCRLFPRPFPNSQYALMCRSQPTLSFRLCLLICLLLLNRGELLRSGANSLNPTKSALCKEKSLFLQICRIFSAKTWWNPRKRTQILCPLRNNLPNIQRRYTLLCFYGLETSKYEFPSWFVRNLAWFTRQSLGASPFLQLEFGQYWGLNKSKLARTTQNLFFIPFGTQFSFKERCFE